MTDIDVVPRAYWLMCLYDSSQPVVGRNEQESGHFYYTSLIGRPRAPYSSYSYMPVLGNVRWDDVKNRIVVNIK